MPPSDTASHRAKATDLAADSAEPPLAIEDYALIGDCTTAALVGRNGSIDWLCWPRFDSGACFAALLGDSRNGRWQIAPASLDTTKPATRVTRQYRDGGVVLETVFETPEGSVALIDFMPMGQPQSSVIRIVEGRRGNVAMQMELALRFDYGNTIPWVTRRPDGLAAIAGPDMVILATPVPLHGRKLTTQAVFTVAAGTRIPFVLSWAPSHLPPPGPVDADQALLQTEAFWAGWSARCTYHGPWQDMVRRSLVTLKVLSFASTGGIVAAVTTSLPEQLGGRRNWDYRFCWIRDATLTLLALMSCGYFQEADEWRDWLHRAIAGSPDQIQIMYGVAGEKRLDEWEVPWLPGYQGAAPVRIGNAASSQLQLDIYGELMDALHHARAAGIAKGDESWSLQRGLLRHLEKIWHLPDEGMWEVRGGRQHFTYSKVMAWAAFDRAVLDAETYGLPGNVAHWRVMRDRIHADICANAIDKKRNCFVQSYGSTALDANLLLIPLVGFLPPSDARVRATLAVIEQDLVEDGFVLRYRTETGHDGLPPGEGAFLACSFWLADNLLLQGRTDEANAWFEKLAALRNDVGLLSEEYDPKDQRLVGNFPQAFSHLALIGTAMSFSGQGPAPMRRRPHRRHAVASPSPAPASGSAH